MASFFLISLLTLSKMRLKVGSVHVVYKYRILLRLFKVSVAQQLAVLTNKRVIIRPWSRDGYALLDEVSCDKV
jgi:hypothetical protein